MEKTQGPTLLLFEKTPSLSRERDGENPRKNDGEKPQENPMQHTQGAHRLMVEARAGLWNKISPNILHIYIVKKKPFNPNIPRIIAL